jgi:hypothetical protein
MYVKYSHFYIFVGNSAQVNLLLKHGARQHIENSEGGKAVTHAVKETSTDCDKL